MESRNRWASLLFSIFSKLSFIILPQPLHLSPQMKHTNCFLAACACNQCCLYLCVRCLLQPTSLILILRLPVPPLSRFELLSGKKYPLQSPGTWTLGSRKMKSCKFRLSHLLLRLGVKWMYFALWKWRQFSGWTFGIQRDYLCNTLSAS